MRYGLRPQCQERQLHRLLLGHPQDRPFRPPEVPPGQCLARAQLNHQQHYEEAWQELKAGTI